MIEANQEALSQAEGAMIGVLARSRNEIQDNQTALRVVGTITQAQRDALAGRLTVTEYAHCDSEIRRIFASATPTEYVPYEAS